MKMPYLDINSKFQEQHHVYVNSSVADPHRKNADADADPGKNLNADADADSCSY